MIARHRIVDVAIHDRGWAHLRLWLRLRLRRRRLPLMKLEAEVANCKRSELLVAEHAVLVRVTTSHHRGSLFRTHDRGQLGLVHRAAVVSVDDAEEHLTTRLGAHVRTLESVVCRVCVLTRARADA